MTCKIVITYSLSTRYEFRRMTIAAFLWLPESPAYFVDITENESEKKTNLELNS